MNKSDYQNFTRFASIFYKNTLSLALVPIMPSVIFFFARPAPDRPGRETRY